MPVLPDFEIVVEQRQPYGCIPTGIEWMLRYLKMEGIDFSDFQEKYDLIYQEKGKNSGRDVSKLIMVNYPEIQIVCKDFGAGGEKINFIRQLISEGRPVLVSITLCPEGGWHIVPVVEIDDDKIVVLWMNKDTIDRQKKEFQCSDIENRHNAWPGGTDLIYIK